MFPKLFGEIAAPAMLPNLLTAATEFRPDVVIHDAAEFASAIVAERLGVPHVTHSFGALVPRDFVDRAGHEVAPLWAAAGLEPRPFGGSYDHLYIDIYPPGMQPGPVNHVPRVQSLRPSAADAVHDEQLPAYLSGAPKPILYVTFGTVFNAAAAFEPLIEASRELEATFIMTVGPNGDPASLGPVPPNVFVERYVPQSLLFEHCAAIISHGGSGTFLGALAHGLPQLCLPQAADQFVNAAVCARLEVGLALEPADVTVDRIVRAVGRLLDEPAFRARAAGIAATIAAMPSPDEVVTVVERLVTA